MNLAVEEEENEEAQEEAEKDETEIQVGWQETIGYGYLEMPSKHQ